MKKKIDYKKQGKRNRERGQEFERKVRKDLESKGWVVDRWTNNVEANFDVKIKGMGRVQYRKKLIPAKSRFGLRTTGFPDFIAFTKPNSFFLYHSEILEIDYVEKDMGNKGYSEVIGVEVKSNGYLTKEEKAKCKWLLDNNKFSKILIVSKGKKRGEIKYIEFKFRRTKLKC